MLKLLLCVSLLCGLSIAATPEPSTCRIPFRVQSYYPPLFFNVDGSLVNTTETNSGEGLVAVLEHGQTVLLSCHPHYFKRRPPATIRNVTCHGGQTLVINSIKVRYNAISCINRPTEEVFATVRDCDSKYSGVKYGITNPVERKSYVLGEACYSVNKSRTVYVHVKLRNNGFTPNDLALSVEDVDFFKGPHPSIDYSIDIFLATNAERLNQTLADLVAPNFDVLAIKFGKFIGPKYVNDKQFLPFVISPWNKYPIFNEAVSTNLAHLEQDILNLDVLNLELWSGCYGVVKVPGKNGQPIDLNLRFDRAPVPKYVWSVVKSNEKATVFVSVNDPTVTESSLAAESVCESKCDEISWITNLAANENYKKVEQGRMFCCSLNDVRTNIPDIPNIVDIVELFK